MNTRSFLLAGLAFALATGLDATSRANDAPYDEDTLVTKLPKGWIQTTTILDDRTLVKSFYNPANSARIGVVRRSPDTDPVMKELEHEQDVSVKGGQRCSLVRGEVRGDKFNASFSCSWCSSRGAMTRRVQKIRMPNSRRTSLKFIGDWEARHDQAMSEAFDYIVANTHLE